MCYEYAESNVRPKLTEKDQGFVEKLGVITFGTFMAMHAGPELVEPGKLVRRVAKQGKVREFWTPKFVGARYKLRREVPKVVDTQFVYSPGREQGTHASPRMHWRRSSLPPAGTRSRASGT
jgi:hypothetical protein